MLLASFPPLDALRGFWAWFGQNAAAVGIVLSFVVSVATIFVLIRTLRAVNKQADAADRQVKAAEEQAAAARKQTEVSEQQRVAAEKAAEAARLQSALARHEMLARLRPFIVVASRQNPNEALRARFPEVVHAENHGQGIALDVKVDLRNQSANSSVGIVHNIVGPGQSALLNTHMDQIRNDGLQITYHSQDGRRFVTTINPGQQAFLIQSTFQVREDGGWVPDPEMPNLS